MTSNFLFGLCMGMVFFMGLQHAGMCGTSCKEAYIQKAMSDHQWSKQVGEDIGQRMCDEKEICTEGDKPVEEISE